MDGPTTHKPNSSAKTVAIGFVWASTGSFSNDSALVLVRFQSTTPNAVKSRQSLTLAPPE